MVPGNYIHSHRVLKKAPAYLNGEHLFVDVSHLRKCLFADASFQAPEKFPRLCERQHLRRLHLYRRISFRKISHKKGAVSLELRKLQMAYPGCDPA